MLASLLGEAKWSRITDTLVDPNIPIKEIEMCNVFNGKTGELLNYMPIPNLHRILRGRLRSLIAEDLADVYYNKNLERISYADDGQGVTAHFADGTAETGRLVIGADGSNSRVRSLLLGPERARLKRLPLAATFIEASFPRELALRLRNSTHPIVNVILHPDNMTGMLGILDGADEDHPENWRFAFYISWRCSVEEQDAEAGVDRRERLRQAKEMSKPFADPLRSCYDAIPDDLEQVYYTRNGNWDPSLPGHEWDNRGGLVTLVGDAAHPMTYRKCSCHCPYVKFQFSLNTARFSY